MNGRQRITPELDVSNLKVSLAFYVGVVGCKILYDRPEENFAYLDCEGSKFMLEEAKGPGRRFRTAPLEYPYGRGVNFQIEVADVNELFNRVRAAGYKPYLPMEEQWYRCEDKELGNRQFVVPDPDGFLLRFFTDLGSRPVPG